MSPRARRSVEVARQLADEHERDRPRRCPPGPASVQAQRTHSRLAGRLERVRRQLLDTARASGGRPSRAADG